MGSLKPDTTYVYERVGGSIFAREFGDTKRKLVGYITDTNPEIEIYRTHINDVLRMCENDLAMRNLLDQLFVLYNLKKNYE